jgi:tetratricopeptide (TPR) repeat protein
VVAELYNMVNVPQAVWIDEDGKIVRPTEVSGAAITFNIAKMRKRRAIYLDAIRDWVAKGAQSEHVFSEEQARAHLADFTPSIALAHANFHLGRYLWEHGDRDEAADFLREATDLNPDSWNFFRQMKNLEAIWGSGGPAYLRRVQRARKAGKVYYPVPDMVGMSEV